MQTNYLWCVHIVANCSLNESTKKKRNPEIAGESWRFHIDSLKEERLLQNSFKLLNKEINLFWSINKRLQEACMIGNIEKTHKVS